MEVHGSTDDLDQAVEETGGVDQRRNQVRPWSESHVDVIIGDAYTPGRSKDECAVMTYVCDGPGYRANVTLHDSLRGNA